MPVSVMWLLECFCVILKWLSTSRPSCASNSTSSSCLVRFKGRILFHASTVRKNKKRINLVYTASVDGVCGLAGEAGSARPIAPRAKLLTPCSLRPAHCALHSQNMAGDFMVPVGDCTVPVRDCLVPASVRKRKKQRSGSQSSVTITASLAVHSLESTARHKTCGGNHPKPNLGRRWPGAVAIPLWAGPRFATTKKRRTRIDAFRFLFFLSGLSALDPLSRRSLGEVGSDPQFLLSAFRISDFPCAPSVIS